MDLHKKITFEGSVCSMDENDKFKIFFKKYLKNDKRYLVMGPRITNNNLRLLNDDNFDIKLIVIFEPIKHFEHFKNVNKIIDNYKNYKNLYLFGCVENKPNENKIKFPLYMMERFPIYENPNQYFSTANNFIYNTDILSKNFCCLINRWDPDNHRTKMHNILKKINTIHCPSNLLHNCSKSLLDKIGKPNYINNFLFNICSENYDNTKEGYITEKLMDCCLGGAIPIYAGWFDEYDEKIFNKNRIIFYNSKDETSYEKVYNQVKELLENKEKLNTFYRQPVFCNTAVETVEKLKENFNIL